MAFTDGFCQLVFRLSAKDVALPTKPNDLIICTPRSAYLPAYFDLITDHFRDFVLLAASSDIETQVLSFSTLLARQIPYQYPIGVLTDIFGSIRTRLELVVTFSDTNGSSEQCARFRSADLFSALYLNQVKVALSLLGTGTSNLNILPKDSLDKLMVVAGGRNEIDMAEFWTVFKTIYNEGNGLGGVAAIKLYVVNKGGAIYSSVICSPLERTVMDVLQIYDLAEYSVRTQGVDLRKETPLHFLRNGCYYADGFVHLVIFKE